MLIYVPSFTSRAGAIAARIGSLIVLLIMGTLATAHAAQLTLTWSDASSNETGFHIQRKTGTGGTYGTLTSVESGTTGYVDGTVTAGTNYCYRVSAYNSAGDSAYSNEACAAATAATTYTVSVTKAGTGTGTVASSPSGINCGSTCSASFASGTSLALSATPAAGSTFTGWSGAYTGTGTWALVVNSTKSVTATFANSSGTTGTAGTTAAASSSSWGRPTSTATGSRTSSGRTRPRAMRSSGT